MVRLSTAAGWPLRHHCRVLSDSTLAVPLVHAAITDRGSVVRPDYYLHSLSPTVQTTLAVAKQYAPSDEPVLLLGEAGCAGKQELRAVRRFGKQQR